MVLFVFQFELVMPDTSVIGKRRLAQRLGGDVCTKLKKASGGSGSGSGGGVMSSAVESELKAALQREMTDAGLSGSGSGSGSSGGSSGSGGALSLSLLERSDDTTSNAIIEFFDGDADFMALAKKQTQAIVTRDTEDGVKLQSGIDIAVAKGVLPADVTVERTYQVDVTGKSADQVADEIISKLDLASTNTSSSSNSGNSGSSGRVIIMQGLSGTGKGTAVAKLESKLPNVVCWSNGNLFRSLTLFAVTHCEQVGGCSWMACACCIAGCLAVLCG